MRQDEHLTSTTDGDSAEYCRGDYEYKNGSREIHEDSHDVPIAEEIEKSKASSYLVFKLVS